MANRCARVWYKVVAAGGKFAVGCIVMLVRAYQIVISPHIGNCCRFEPSCSAYTIEALRRHGLLRGCWLSARRIMRCRPYGPQGYDPVPPPGEQRKE